MKHYHFLTIYTILNFLNNFFQHQLEANIISNNYNLLKIINLTKKH